ncbi:YbaB/EbfC family DNA-binding protein [Pseudonocardiaceae bacterium YIM PH 21723]|nr:YbaB/EbfC family DNA-binding protein [Pseudonocardiaceae bacterium YIM PH 21723]
MGEEFDALVREFERFQQATKQADERLAGYAGMQEEITAVTATVQSPDRSVTVTAGPGGSVRGIDLTDAALRLNPKTLSGTIMSTLQQAVAAAARQQAAVVQRYVGSDMNILDQVLETQSEMLGVPVAQLRGESVAPAPVEDDGDFSNDSIFRRGDR